MGSPSLDVCVLSIEEAARLEHWGVWPKCKAHHHIKASKAAAAVEDETHRFVGGPDTEIAEVGSVSMIVPTFINRGWVPVACHGADGKPIRGMRTWGNPPIV